MLPTLLIIIFYTLNIIYKNSPENDITGKYFKHKIGYYIMKFVLILLILLSLNIVTAHMEEDVIPASEPHPGSFKIVSFVLGLIVVGVVTYFLVKE